MRRQAIGMIALLTLFAGPWMTADEASSACSSLADIDWIVGRWVAEDGSSGESWTRVSPSTFEGVGRVGSTEESLRLVEMSGQVFFLAKVDHNPMPTPFHATTCSAEQAVFENPEHDFPRRLDYQRDGDSLTVTVSDGETRGFQLRWQRRSE
ncbi:MAG: DUF6265 family protein [Acidobacteriota bacterium]